MIRLATITQTCGACPTQYEGATEDGRLMYSRFRHNVLSVRIYPKDDADNRWDDRYVVLHMRLNQAADGYLRYEKWQELVKDVIDTRDTKWLTTYDSWG